jgi:hypothetical protein
MRQCEQWVDNENTDSFDFAIKIIDMPTIYCSTVE